MGAQLTVRESQCAIFLNEGNIADVFAPGRYELTTQNMPIMTKLKSWKFGFDSPFKADVYFINTKQFLNQKWGTSSPVMMRDPEFGMIRLMGFGIFSYKVDDPVKFLKEVFGTKSLFTTEEMERHLRGLIVSGLTDYIAEAKISAADLATQYDEIGTGILKKLDPKLGEYGLKLVSFIVEKLSLPEEVEKMIDKKTSMKIMGDTTEYAKFQMADSIDEMAKNGGNPYVEMGMGMNMGQMMGNMLNQQNSQNSQMSACPHCGKNSPAGSKFCSSCGKEMSVQKKPCARCGKPVDLQAKFCPECGAPQDQKARCTKCSKEVPSGTKFCPDCGTPLS
jgi:membrane protease subunit (stomatin/prohibitin family)